MYTDQEKENYLSERVKKHKEKCKFCFHKNKYEISIRLVSLKSANYVTRFPKALRKSLVSRGDRY